MQAAVLPADGDTSSSSDSVETRASRAPFPRHLWQLLRQRLGCAQSAGISYLSGATVQGHSVVLLLYCCERWRRWSSLQLQGRHTVVDDRVGKEPVVPNLGS